MGAGIQHSKEIQWMNDFICRLFDRIKGRQYAQGYQERFFLQLLRPRRIVELSIVKLNDQSQIMFLFKEISIYNKLSKAKTTEKFSNILINSIAHNLFTPLNALI